MEDSHFCNESCYCPMKLDMENTNNKLAFLKENWPDLERPEQINNMSARNLKCSLCVMEIIINALAREEFYCPYREVIRLVNTQTIIQNTIELHKVQEELEEELQKLQKDRSSQECAEKSVSMDSL